MGSAAVPTIREVARLAGVSVATVSKALNGSGRVSQPLQERVFVAARSLGYAPHPSARSLRSGATRILGLLVADITNPFFLRLVEGIERIASAEGYSVLLCNSAEDAEREQRNLQMLLAQRADGIILIPTRNGWSGRVAALSDLPLPAILVDRMIEGLDLDSVTLDNRMAGRLAAEHLLGLGHTRVGIIMGSPDHQIARHRLEGFREGFADAGLSLDERLVEKNNFTEASAHTAAMRLLARDDRPSAIFATNVHIAFGLLGAVSELGIQLPSQLSIVTVDPLPWVGFSREGLTTVIQPSDGIAEATVATLLGRIRNRTEIIPEKPKAVVLSPRLVPGGSTRASETTR